MYVDFELSDLISSSFDLRFRLAHGNFESSPTSVTRCEQFGCANLTSPIAQIVSKRPLL